MVFWEVLNSIPFKASSLKSSCLICRWIDQNKTDGVVRPYLISCTADIVKFKRYSFVHNADAILKSIGNQLCNILLSKIATDDKFLRDSCFIWVDKSLWSFELTSTSVISGATSTKHAPLHLFYLIFGLIRVTRNQRISFCHHATEA